MTQTAGRLLCATGMPPGRRTPHRWYQNKKGNPLKYVSAVLVLIGIISVFALAGCGSSSSETGEHDAGSEADEGGEKSGDDNIGSEAGEGGEGSESGEHEEDDGEAGEESGIQLATGEVFDEVRAGARLVISYDPTTNAFLGSVTNTTGATLGRVRVEVHLSNGVELGPTTPVDLAPGQSVDVILPSTSQPFVSWSAHPEVG